jgi:chemotaxis signal transduction protein
MHEVIAIDARHPWLIGFAAVGGAGFPVIDLREKLGIAPGPRGREQLIVAIATTGRIFGFVADRVSEVVNLRARDFRDGVVRTIGRARKVLDPNRIMSEEDWTAQAAARSRFISQ